MEIGISTASFFTKVATENTFEIIKDFGASVCEVFLSSFCEYDGILSESIVKNKCINVNSVHTLTNQYEPELFSLNPRASEDAEIVMRKALNTGKKLGAKYYTFHGATRLKKINYNLDFVRIGKVISHIMNVCSEYNIQLSYETVHWAYFNYPEFFVKLKEQCPNLKATLDIKQIMQAGEDYRNFLNVIGKDLTTVHLCDYDSERKLYIPGKGTFDFVEMFKRLKDIGFDGACIMEVYPQGYENLQQLKASYEYLLECLDKTN